MCTSIYLSLDSHSWVHISIFIDFHIQCFSGGFRQFPSAPHRPQAQKLCCLFHRGKETEAGTARNMPGALQKGAEWGEGGRAPSSSSATSWPCEGISWHHVYGQGFMSLSALFDPKSHFPPTAQASCAFAQLWASSCMQVLFLANVGLHPPREHVHPACELNF